MKTRIRNSSHGSLHARGPTRAWIWRTLRGGFFVTSLLLSLPLQGGQWDGGGDPDPNTGLAANWVGNTLPNAAGADVIFAGNLNTNVNNNYLTQLNSLTFASGAGSFVIGGDGLDAFPTSGAVIVNNSTNTQTIALDFPLAGGMSTSTLAFGVSNSRTVFSGDLSGNGTLAVEGAFNETPYPVFVLSGTNTFGGIRVTSATLELASSGSVGSAQITLNNNAASFDNVTGAAINATGNMRLAGNPTFSGSDDFITTGILTLAYPGNGNRSFTIAGSTLGVGGLVNQNNNLGNFTKAGAGTLAISGAATDFEGRFIASAGTTLIGHQDALGTAEVVLRDDGTLAASTDLSGANAVGNTLTLDGNATLGGDHNLTISGDIGEVDTPDPGDSLTIDSTAIIEFSGTNSYTGVTFVNVGTLLINGDQSAATGSLTVASGAVLGGSGTIGGETIINGSLRPGNSIGTLSVADDVTWNSGQPWVFELGAANTSDLLDITDGAFLKGGGTTFEFDFAASGADGLYTLISWTSTADLSGGALGTSFIVDDFSYANLAPGYTGTFLFDGTSLQLAVIPEPATAILLIGALAALSIRRRRYPRCAA